ncbi:probable transcription factor At5g28040 [Elaeis guineensis]|uniref:Probable transcription factor At3g04930 n=1 Tax=Elaeis guineensis var. tenera TaxID=51953 RepID=A0A6I9QIU9_ELAGV|nr:probable transcription factor At3g04930 [Elaeis guineensis]
MPSAEEEEERAVFEDDDDDDDDDDLVGDDTEEDEEEDYEDDDAEAAPPLTVASAPPPPPAPANPAAAEENLNDSTPSTSSSSDRAAPNPKPNLCATADPQNGAIPVLPISAAAPAAAAAGSLFTPSSSDPVPQPSADGKPVPVAVAAVGGGYDDSRRLFQRLWTDEDEITILKGFLEFTSRRGTTFASHQYDTGPFYEEIKKQLQLEFTKNQLIEKLRRLKKKYRNVVGRMRSMGKDFAFKSPHEQAIHDIARNIWSANVKRARDSDDDDLNTPNNASYTIEATSAADGAMNSERRMSRSRRRFRRGTAEEAAAPTVGVPVENSVPATQVASSEAAAIPGIIEETVKSCLSPLFKELIYSATGGPLGGGAALLGLGLGGVGAALSPLPLSLGGSPASVPASGTPVDEKWKQQHILELEVYLKRIELVRDRIKSTLEELKSSGS